MPKQHLAALTLITAALSAANSALCAADSVSSNPTPSIPVVWESPSADSWGSMPIGNGDIGANVWVEPSGDLVLLLSKSDAWDEASRLCKLGRIRMKLPSVKNFRQELRTGEGEIRITAGGVTTRVWVDANHPVVHVEMDGEEPFTTSVAHETWRKREKVLKGAELRSCWGQQGSPEAVRISADTVLDGQQDRIIFFHRNPSSVWEKNLRNQALDALVKPENDPLLHRTFGALVRGENLGVDDKGRLVPAKPVAKFAVAIHALTAITPTAEDWVKHVTAQAVATERAPLEQAWVEHVKWWQAFWNRSWIVAHSTTMLPLNDQPWQVGVDSNGGSRFGGTITGPRVVGRALSAAEIEKLAGEAPAADTELKPEPLTTGCTMMAWIKPGTGEKGRILDKTPLGKARGMLFDTHPGMALRLIVGHDTMIQPNCLKPGTWQHVAATLDAGTGMCRIYLQGKLVAEKRIGTDAERVTRGYQLQRWINACAGRGAYPIKFNGSLFNVETLIHPVKSYNGLCRFDADFREWGNPYWSQNTRLPYWTMPAAGDFDLMQPLFKMYMDALPLRKHLTRSVFNHEGAFYPETIEFWGTAADRDFGRKQDARRRDMPPGQTTGYAQDYPQGALEMLHIMNSYFEHTGDTAFRDATLLPFGKAITDYYRLHFQRTPEGKLCFTGLTSLEQATKTTNPLPDIAGLKVILPILASYTSDAAQRTEWLHMLADLPPLPVKENKNGRRTLAMADKTPARVSGYEKPELYAVFPYRIYGLGRPDLELALETWKQRRCKGTGGWQQDAIQAALLGLVDEAKTYVTQNYSRTSPGFRFPAMWGPNYDWTPDQDHGCVPMTALQAMLLQPVGDPSTGWFDSAHHGSGQAKIYLFPAWPKEWNVSFKLHAPKNTTVECELRGGKVVKLVVTPEARRKDVEICPPFVLETGKDATK